MNEDLPLLDFVHVENVFADLQKSNKPQKDLDLVV